MSVATSASPHQFRGPCLIVAHDPTEGTVPLTLDELLFTLARVYVLTTSGAPDANVVWLVDWPEVAPCAS